MFLIWLLVTVKMVYILIVINIITTHKAVSFLLLRLKKTNHTHKL